MNRFNELITQNEPVLVDFHATWCGPCKMMAPILKQVKKQLGDTIKIIKIDVDKNQLLASKFSVRGVPTLILFNKGNSVWRQSGVVQANQLIEIINSNK